MILMGLRNFYIWIVIAISLGLVSCSGTFVIRPSGNFDESVEFSFYDSFDDQNSSEKSIVQFVVQEQKEDGGWAVVWELRGSASLDGIRYGASYEGLVENASAQPLLKGARYRVIASSQPKIGPIEYSAVYFGFTDDGVVTVGSSQ